MLIKLSVENFKSFDQKAEFSMISSSKIRKNSKHCLKIKQTNLLKNAAIYGANASGKSNFVEAFAFIQAVLTDGLTVSFADCFCRTKEENKTRKSVFELQFTVKDKFYAYGFSAILHEGNVTGEWLYELLQNGQARQIFVREGNKAPVLGFELDNDTEEKRFKVYSNDFIGQNSYLFLPEMYRAKNYGKKSKLMVFKNVYTWIRSNIVVVKSGGNVFAPEEYYKEESIKKINKLLQIFDTGISQIDTEKISLEEFEQVIPKGNAKNLFRQVRQSIHIGNMPYAHMAFRPKDSFFVARIQGNSDPDIRALTIKHGDFDFDFAEESDGTKRLFDLLCMLLPSSSDTVFVVDELERSLHPKLTEKFLRFFMSVHEKSRMQIIFTTHENTIMNQDLFRRDEIWFVERDMDNASHMYSLDRFKERYDKKIDKNYLEGRYGAVPIFRNFNFQKED